MTSYYRFSEKEYNEAVEQHEAYTLALSNLERTGDSENADYAILIRKLQYNIGLTKDWMARYEQQLVQDACEHEWVDESMYRSYCPKCKYEELNY